jgi:hypothetical protein
VAQKWRYLSVFNIAYIRFMDGSFILITYMSNFENTEAVIDNFLA